MKPRIGFTYPTVTGENQTEAFRRILSEFPAMQAWSHYYSGLPDWSAAWFQEAPADCEFFISTKTSDVNSLAARCAEIPEPLRGRIVMVLHHEPDQWRSASDPRSDPAPDVWWARQLAFLDAREGEEWEPWVEHMVVYTEDRARTDNAFWETNWGQRWDPRIDRVGFDCFNIGRSIVRPGSDIFNIPLAYARGRGVPLVIREWGQVTPVDSPEDSLEVAEAVAEHYDYMKANPDVSPTLVWYYNHNNTLVDPSGQRPGRPWTFAQLEMALDDARTPEEEPVEPDPQDPQYQMGYSAGWNARQPEVDSLTADVSALTTENAGLVTQTNNLMDALVTAQNEAAAAKSQGRLEAFAETRDWAAGRS